MDVKRTQGYTAPVLLQRPKSGSDGVRSETSGASLSSAGSSGSSRVGSLVETGRAAAMSQHDAMLEGLRRDIESGTYKTNWDVVAQRLGEALEA